MKKAQSKFDEFFVTYGWLIILVIIAVIALWTFQGLREQEQNSAPTINNITCETTNIQAELYMFNQTLTIGRYKLTDAEWKNTNCTTNEQQIICEIK